MTQLTDDDIRRVFLANGFTVKEGQADLKPYVFQAARALIGLAVAQQVTSQEPDWLPVPPAEHIHTSGYLREVERDDRVRCIEARNKLNAVLHGDGAVIDSLEEAVARACSLLRCDWGTFQSRVLPWLMACFGESGKADAPTRAWRFLEEALELVQACGTTKVEAHQLVEYVFGRPAGEKSQEVGGVMVTLAALNLAHDLDMHEAGERELARISTPDMVVKIRAKSAAKPKYGPLPGPSAPESLTVSDLIQAIQVCDAIANDSESGDAD